MPETINDPVSSRLPTILWATITGIGLFQAWPIVDGWLHDPSLRMGLPCFVLWVLAVVIQWRGLPDAWPSKRILWMVMASLMLCLGVVGELQALIYLAVAILLVLPIESHGFKRPSFIGLAGIWMPVSAWLFFPLLGNHLALIKLLIGTFLLGYSLSVLVRSLCVKNKS
jgi:hypothetical protein